MAKPRKPKTSGDVKPDNSVAVVRHQKLCLSIDIDKRRIFGFTELEIAVPDIGIVGLYAENLEIESISVDGEPAEFEYYPLLHQHVEKDSRWNSVSSPSSAADAAGSLYFSSLERELIPNLLINCCKAYKNGSEQQEQLVVENGEQNANEAKQNVRLVHIDYWVEKAKAGIHFNKNSVHTDNQIRRARCWFPCMDDGLQRCCFDMEFTVAHGLVAVSTGTLLYQVLGKDVPPSKTYVYRLDIPVNAQFISLAVGPFEILSDHQITCISHMCMPNNLSKLRNSVEFFHNAFSLYKDYLSADFPFESYKQVFIEPEMSVSSSSFGASMCIFSSHLLFDEKVIDKTIETWIKLASAFARQWFGVYITPESSNDEWLVDGLASFLTDMFIEKYLGNNEACYRRYKANSAVCKADSTGATALSASSSCKDLYGTHCIGMYGKIRSWKAVAILKMLEKQMGFENFRKILQTIVSRAEDTTLSSKSLSTKEFRQFANKIGNLERPFLKEFFPRWVGSCGCPVLRCEVRMSFSNNKRKIEMVVLRESTALLGANASDVAASKDSESRSDTEWPGIMTIRVCEIEGLYDHPVLPLNGESSQFLEIPCYAKPGAKRPQKTKKGTKPDGSDDNGDMPAHSSLDVRLSMETPVLWLRADPGMEYLSEIHFHQPVQMWINQLEKDKDVVAQAQAIGTMQTLPHLPFAVVNGLNNFLIDSKAFWRVRIDAAFALADTASEDSDTAGLHNLIKYYKSRRFDANTGLPKPNDFRNFAEYFVLEERLASRGSVYSDAIPHAVAMIRGANKKSPREAVEFILQLLKYNDNNGNSYSDVYWLGALVQSIGELEFGQQSIIFLASLLKRIDRILQFERLMPSYNGILTISCIQTLTQIALKLSGFLPLDRVFELIRPYRKSNVLWQVRIEASKALLELEFHSKGIDGAILLFGKYLEEETSWRGQVKLAVYTMQLCQMSHVPDSSNFIQSETLVALLQLLESNIAFNNVYLRHYLFCILQVLAGRPPTLYGVPRHQRPLQAGDTETGSEQKKIFTALVSETNQLEISAFVPNPLEPLDFSSFPPDGLGVLEACKEVLPIQEVSKEEQSFLEASKEAPSVLETTKAVITIPETANKELILPEGLKEMLALPEGVKEVLPLPEASVEAPDVPEASKEATVSVSQGRRKPIFKIKVRSSTYASGAQETNTRGGNQEIELGQSSSVSVDAPQRNFTETVSVSNQNLEEDNSCHNHWSRMTASIGSAKIPSDGDELGREFQCTADSSRALALPNPDNPSSSSIIHDSNIDLGAQKYASLQTLSTGKYDLDGGSFATVDSLLRGKKEKKRDKEKKRSRAEHKEHRDDPAYLEHKRLKKEKKQKKKEMAKLMKNDANPSLTLKKDEPEITSSMANVHDKQERPVIKLVAAPPKPSEPSRSKAIGADTRPEPSSGTPAAPKIRLKIKTRTMN